MGEIRTFTPRAGAPQATAAPGPVAYPALTREQARLDFLFGARACRDHLDALIARIEADCPVGEAMARARVLNDGLETTGRVLTVLHQLGDAPATPDRSA